MSISNMRKFLKFLPAIVFGLTLASCQQDFDHFFVVATEIEITDLRNAYSVGQIFSEKNHILGHAKYSDGSEKDLTYKDLRITLSNKGKLYSPSKAFEVGGNYKVVGYIGQKASAPIEITVSNEEVYAESITATIGKASLKTMEITYVDFDVSPSNYTVDVELISNKETSYIERFDANSFMFYEEKEGDLTLSVKAGSSSGEVSSNIPVSVSNASEVVEIQQTYKSISTVYSPSLGEVNYLIIPVWFTDSSTYINPFLRNNIISDVRKAYFGSPSETGWHSVASYYKTESMDQFILGGTVSNSWYECEHTISQIGCDNSDSTSNLTRKLIKNAVNWYFENNTEDDRTNYDSDGDGLIDGVVIIYGAPDCRAYGVEGDYLEYSNLWAYSSRVVSNSASVTEPVVESFFWASYDFMYGYLEAVDRTGYRYHKGSTAYCKLDTHTYIHETGHILGLADYYDYSSQYNPAGGFSMQDYNVGGHDPYSVMAFGWANPNIPTESCRIKLHSFQSTHELILLTPSWNSYNSCFDEYILLELYTADGLNGHDAKNQYAPVGAKYPLGPNTVGLRVWHVDARLTYQLPGEINKYSTSLTVNALDTSKRGYTNAFTNTYVKDGKITDHCSKLCVTDKKYSNFNILQLIRNDEKETHLNTSLISNKDLFKAGDDFSISKFANQFPYKQTFGGSLNVLISGATLGWEFSIESVSKDSAIIVLNRI